MMLNTPFCALLVMVCGPLFHLSLHPRSGKMSRWDWRRIYWTAPLGLLGMTNLLLPFVGNQAWALFWTGICITPFYVVLIWWSRLGADTPSTSRS